MRLCETVFYAEKGQLVVNSSIAEQIIDQLRGVGIGQIAQQVGANTQQTESAIGAAVPLLLSALGKNLEGGGGGAQSLFGALLGGQGAAPQAPAAGSGAAGLDWGALLGSVVGAVSANANPSASAGSRFDAGSLLNTLLGSNLGKAQDSLSQASGVSAAGIQKLLAILAPIVMNFLSQQMAKSPAQSPEALGAMLGKEANSQQAQGGVVGSLLTAVLDQDGNGKLDAGDLLKFGASFFGKK